MDNFVSSYMYLTSFDKIYNTNIKPKLEAIDIFLKSSVAPYDINKVAMLFDTSVQNISKTMDMLHLKYLDRIGFFTLMCHLPHDICHLIQRQWKYQGKSQYTPEMIAHIYMLNLDKVKNAFNELNLSLVYENELIEVFKRIHISIFYF